MCLRSYLNDGPECRDQNETWGRFGGARFEVDSCIILQGVTNFTCLEGQVGYFALGESLSCRV